MLTHIAIMSDVMYNYKLPGLSKPLFSFPVRAYAFGGWDHWFFLSFKSISSEFYLFVFATTPLERKCIIPGPAPCPVRQRTITLTRQATTLNKASQVSRTVIQHFHKSAAFMNKVSNNTRK